MLATARDRLPLGLTEHASSQYLLRPFRAKQTYWLAHKPSTGSLVSRKKGEGQQSNEATEEGEAPPATMSLMSNKMSNLVQWNVEVLAKSLKQIIASRTENDRASMVKRKAPMLIPRTKPTEEVVEIVTLPKHPKQFLQNPDDLTLDEVVTSQLRQYGGHVAALYRQNPFHNFEHASVSPVSIVTPFVLFFGTLTFAFCSTLR